MMIISLEQAKLQCRIEPELTDDDVYLESLIEAACCHIEADINKRLVVSGESIHDGQLVITPSLQMAARLLVGHWYVNREAVVTGSLMSTVTLAYDALVEPYRDVLVG